MYAKSEVLLTLYVVLKCLNITPIHLSSTAWPISSAHHLNAGGPPFLHTYALSSDRVSFSFPSICTSGTPPFNNFFGSYGIYREICTYNLLHLKSLLKEAGYE